MRVFVAWLLAAVLGGSECCSQNQKQAPSYASEVASLVADEAKRGEYVFYTQSFIDKENQRASYHGSVYAAIQVFELENCEVNIEAIIVDKFSGTVGRRPTGEMQDTYHYSAMLALTPEIAAGLTLLEARPAQLSSKTHSVCEEQPSCSFWWVRFQVKSRIIHEESTVNDAPEFSGQVDRFVVPISSPDIGKRLIEEMRGIAKSGCH